MPAPLPSVTNVRISDYEKVSEWIETLNHLRIECKTVCLDSSKEDAYTQMSDMIQTRSDEEWNSVCRQIPNVKNVKTCEQYHTTFHQTRALILKLNDICKKINTNIQSLKIRMQYAFSMDDFARDQEQKISAMTLSEFEKKINQKINACVRFSIRKCELSKIQIYIDSINKLNVNVRSQWDAFTKTITPLPTMVDTIKDILKKKFDPKLLSGLAVKKESDSEWYHVTGDMIPELKVNPRTGDIIEVDNIQAAGKHNKTRNKMHSRRQPRRHSIRHSIRHSRRHSIRHSRRHSRRQPRRH
jgi:hypothetical protein